MKAFISLWTSVMRNFSFVMIQSKNNFSNSLHRAKKQSNCLYYVYYYCANQNKMPLEMTRYGTVHSKGINYRRKRKTRQIQINLPTDYKMYLFILLLIHWQCVCGNAQLWKLCVTGISPSFSDNNPQQAALILRCFKKVQGGHEGPAGERFIITETVVTWHLTPVSRLTLCYISHK